MFESTSLFLIAIWSSFVLESDLLRFDNEIFSMKISDYPISMEVDSITSLAQFGQPVELGSSGKNTSPNSI